MIREFILVALACAGICQGLIACTENFCKGVTCEPLNCSANQTVFPKGTLCGCCPACGTILKAGDECPTVKVVGGPPPLIVCAEGLECVEGTCKRPSKCAAKTTPEQTE